MFSLATWIRGGFIAAISGILGLLAGASRLIGRRDREMLQVFFFIISGMLIVAAGWWWVTSVRENYFSGEHPPFLGTVEIHGGPAGDLTALKREFPRLVLSELNSLQAKANSAIGAIRQARQSIGNARVPADTRFQDVEAPSLLAAPFDVELKVADVDVGSLLSWISKRNTENNQLKLNIVYGQDASKATVYGTVVGRPAYSFSAHTDGAIDAIVREVATIVIQKEAVKSDERLVSLDAESFTTLIDSLHELALTEKQSPFLNAGRISANKKLLEKLKEVGGFTQFPELQWLMAKTAENAELWKEAAGYYENLLAYYDSGRVGNLTAEELSARRQEISDKIGSLENREKARLAAEETPEPGEATQLPGLAKLQSRTVCGDFSGTLSQLGMDAPRQAQSTTIGMVGTPSDAISKALDASTSQPAASGPAEASPRPIDDYIASISQAARAVAKEVGLAFAGPVDTMTRDSQLLESLQELTEVDGVKVVLMTFGSSPGSDLNPAYRSLVEVAKDRTVFVFAAGNSMGKGTFQPSYFAGLADIALVSQALDPEGKAAYFTNTAEGGVWTPGVSIPYCDLSSGETVTGSGTSFSAALTAAMAAILAAEFPHATASQIVSALKSASGGPPTAPVPLTYSAAKEKLQALFPSQ